MENLSKIIAEHPFLKELAKEHIDLITGCASNVVFKPNEFLFSEGESADHFYIIRHGRVVIQTHVPERGTIDIQTRGEGDITGWSWLVPPYRWHFDAKATELTRAVKFDGKCLREKLENDHSLGYELMRRFALIMAERLEATRLQLMDVYGTGESK